VFTKIQAGIWVPDTEAAIDFFIRRTGVRNVVLGGLCGGAITALLTGARHPEVAGVFMMGNPTTSYSKTSDVLDLPETVLSRDAKLYWMKLFSPYAWIRLLTLRTDFVTLWKVLISRIYSRAKQKRRDTAGAENSKLSPFFVRSFNQAIAEEKKLIFIYSENDYLWHEFKEYFSPSLKKGTTDRFELITIPHANHNLTEAEWQEELHKSLLAWLGGIGGSASDHGR
jgi:uncharacterized protein